MPFSSINFLILLPLLLLVYWHLPERWRRGWLLVSSVVVYMSAGWRDLALLVGITAANWLASAARPQSRSLPRAMIVANLVFLGWFKYRYFIGSWMGMDGGGELIIPLGISFYVFQLISYQVERLNGLMPHVPTFYSFFLYIFFFPHHQSGPIMRPHKFVGAFLSGRRWSTVRFKLGVAFVMWGLFKKIWIADWLMAGLVTRGYGQLHESGGATGNVLLLGVTYGIQIYADFSGYSDIAVGLGRLFGFKLDRNFHQPYVSAGPSEFWRRWHVTLSQWLRDHVYKPLGGNRKGPNRTLANLMAVMLLGGLWHGAGWCFVLWGFLHGSFLVLERMLGRENARTKWARILLFQTLFMIAWIPFRETSLPAIGTLFSRWDAWVSVDSLVALAWGVGIYVFSRAEDFVERSVPAVLRKASAVPDLAFAGACAAVLLAVLTGVRHETIFIYQRF